MNRIKPKVLVIPSWYPNADNTSGGSQFREQSELLLDCFDVRVLLSDRTKLYHLQWFFRYGKHKAGDLEISVTPAGLVEGRFEYHSWFSDEKHLIGSQIEAYKEVLSQWIQEGWKPDLIHVRCTDPAGIIASRLAVYFNLPWVLSEHQVFALGNFSKYRARLMKKAINSASVVTAVSQHQLRSIVTNYIYRPITVVGNLIDETRFLLAEPAERSGIFKVLAVLYPSPIKDPETLFKAIAELKRKGHSDIRVTIIGRKLFSNSDTGSFELLAQKYGVVDMCDLVPYVPPTEMTKYYSETHVLVSTSLAETFGIAVREAMMVGKPVVCTASGGVDDDIFDFNGFKVDIYDHQAIAEALIKIKTGIVCFDPVRIREYVISKYGCQASLQKMSVVYENALQKGDKK